MTPFRYYRYL